MNEDDLYEPKLTAAPGTSPLVRGAAVAVVVGAMMVGCTGPANPVEGLDGGSPGLVYDAGTSGPVDAPGVDVGIPGVDVGVRADASPGVDAGNPGSP